VRSINDDILYGIDNSINNEKAKHRIKQEREKLDYEKQYYIKEIERLNNIINKAIEYVKTKNYCSDIFTKDFAIFDKQELLDILKGDDK